MSNLIKQIFESVILQESDTHKMGSRMDSWIAEHTAPLSNQLDAELMEEVKNLLYATALRSEEEGFQLGIKTLIKLILEMMADS